MVGRPDLNRRPLDPQAESGGFANLGKRAKSTSDLGFYRSVAFNVLHCLSFSGGLFADSCRALVLRTGNVPVELKTSGDQQAPAAMFVDFAPAGLVEAI